MKPVWLIGLSLLLSVFGWGQHFYSRNFTVNDGLPSNTIHCIYKDSRGVMWIGTGSGLCRFDGKGFQIFGISNGLAGDNVFSITEDDQDNLWIGCMKSGISKYDGRRFTNYTSKQGLVSDNVRVVWFSKRFHLLLIGTNDGSSVFDGKQFVSLTTKETQTPDFIVTGFLNGQDYINIYPYRKNDYYRYYPQTRSFKKIISTYYPDHPTSTSPVILPNGDTIMGSLREGINILNHGIRKSFKDMGQVFGICAGEKGGWWISAWSENPLSKELPGGLFLYNGKKVDRYSEKVGITDPTVWCNFYDTSFHILWVGTLNSGLYKIPLPAFEWYDKEDFGLNEMNIKSLFVNANNTLWIGTKGNLFYRKPDGKVNIYQTDFLKKVFKYRKESPLEFSCINKDSRGNIYVSTIQSPLQRFSLKDGYRNPLMIQINTGGTKFCFDSHDSLFYTDPWWDGIFQCAIDPKISARTFHKFGVTDAPPNTIKLISSGDTIWYCSMTEGLFMSYHGMFKCFRKTDSTLPRAIKDICFDRNGNLIVGSNSGEVLIVRYEKNGLKVKYRLQPGGDIIGTTVKFIVVDHSHHLFVGTNLGLNRLDLQSLYKSHKVLTNFYNSEVGYFDYSGRTATVDRNGNIWVGTDSHLLRIDPKLLDKLSSIIPQISITALDVNYQPLKDYSSVSQFPYQENNLIFYFESKNFLNPQQSLYRYKLEGLSDRWAPWSSEAKAVFTSLNPGKYRFTIESINTIDNSKTAKVEYSFRIGFPWYLKWWAVVGMILLLIVSIWIIIWFRTEAIRKEEQKKTDFSKRLAEIEMRALQSQMNPHFVFNCINSIQGFILKHKVDDALGYLMDFSKILRQTLDNASKEFITLEEEVDYIQCYLNLELMRFDKKFSVDLKFPEELNPQCVQLPPMIIQPYIENAIRHGLVHKENGQGLLSVGFKIQGDLLHCSIEDNGVGRKKSKDIESWKNQSTHKPQSTRITQDRIDLLNKSLQSGKHRINIIDLYDHQGVGIGTRVEITLPLMTC